MCNEERLWHFFSGQRLRPRGSHAWRRLHRSRNASVPRGRYRRSLQRHVKPQSRKRRCKCSVQAYSGTTTTPASQHRDDAGCSYQNFHKHQRHWPVGSRTSDTPHPTINLDASLAGHKTSKKASLAKWSMLPTLHRCVAWDRLRCARNRTDWIPAMKSSTPWLKGTTSGCTRRAGKRLRDCHGYAHHCGPQTCRQGRPPCTHSADARLHPEPGGRTAPPQPEVCRHSRPRRVPHPVPAPAIDDAGSAALWPNALNLL